MPQGLCSWARTGRSRTRSRASPSAPSAPHCEMRPANAPRGIQIPVLGQDGRCAYRVGCHWSMGYVTTTNSSAVAPAACARRTLRAPRWTLLHTCGGNTCYRVASWRTVLHHGALSCNMHCATMNPFPVTVRKGWGERSPGADVAGGAQSFVQMGQRRAQSRCRCGKGRAQVPVQIGEG